MAKRSMADSTDQEIMRLLELDPRQSAEELAARMSVSSATVRRRMKRLMESGTIHLAVFADPAKLGKSLAAVVGLSVPSKNLNRTQKMLSDDSRVEWCASATGRFDILCFARFGAADDLNTFLQKDLPDMGVSDTETFMCLHISKGYFAPVSFLLPAESSNPPPARRPRKNGRVAAAR